MLIWVLLMVFLTPSQDFDTAYLLNKFDTQDECRIERDRVGYDMAEAYPNDLSFRIVCREHETEKVATPDV
jgi:hypothetical protein